MTPVVILLIAGVGFLLICLLGGGFTSQWITVPKVDGFARGFCGVIGVLLLITGIVLTTRPTDTPPGANTNVPQVTESGSKAQPTTFEIFYLSPPGQYTHINFLFDDTIAAVLDVPGSSAKELSVIVPSAGLHRFVASGSRKGISGAVLYDDVLTGSGIIDVAQQRMFVVSYTGTSPNLGVNLTKQDGGP